MYQFDWGLLQASLPLLCRTTWRSLKWSFMLAHSGFTVHLRAQWQNGPWQSCWARCASGFYKSFKVMNKKKSPFTFPNILRCPWFIRLKKGKHDIITVNSDVDISFTPSTEIHTAHLFPPSGVNKLTRWHLDFIPLKSFVYIHRTRVHDPLMVLWACVSATVTCFTSGSFVFSGGCTHTQKTVYNAPFSLSWFVIA